MSADNGKTLESEWDDEAFRTRVAAIAKQQHRTVREVCLKAGLAHDYLAKTTYSGRNIRAILALASSLEVPAADLLFSQKAGGQFCDVGATRCHRARRRPPLCVL